VLGTSLVVGFVAAVTPIATDFVWGIAMVLAVLVGLARLAWRRRYAKARRRKPARRPQARPKAVRASGRQPATPGRPRHKKVGKTA
jgi:hypothetical protein